MRRIISSFTLLFLSVSLTFSQIGGDNVYEFLNVPLTARIGALGGSLISVRDYDASLSAINPSLLNPQMHQDISFSTNIHIAGITTGYAGYAHHIPKWKSVFNGGLQFISYGTFTGTDETGALTGDFKASEIALTLGGAYQYSENINVGANLKLANAKFESYNSLGFLADVGISYADTATNFSAALVFRNFGTQISKFTPGNNEPVPFDIQVAISKKLKYLPLRISITAHNLQRWNIRYDDPNQVEPTGLFSEPTEKSDFVIFADNLFRHLIFSGELLIGQNEVFQIRLGYNHLRRAELTVDNLRSLAGFSGGFGLKIKRFRIGYGLGVYHLGGSMNQFTISTNIGEFAKG